MHVRTQGYVGDFHLSGFTETWMRHALEVSGFEVVYFGRHDEWLLDVVAKKVRHSPPDRLITEGTNEEFVDAAYRTILNREPDAEGEPTGSRSWPTGLRGNTSCGTSRTSEAQQFLTPWLATRCVNALALEAEFVAALAAQHIFAWIA